MRFISFFIFFSIFYQTHLWAQEDTSRINRQERIRNIQNQQESEKTLKRYQRLKKFFEKKKFLRQVYGWVFIEPDSAVAVKDQAIIKDQNLIKESYFEKFNGKIIDSITIKKLEVFGSSIQDTSKHARNFIERTGNRLHIDTRTWVIRNNLLFTQGDSLNADLMRDNERILRQMSYLLDARIIISPSKKDKNKVNVLVLTQDKWSIEGSVSGLGGTVMDKNILGLGNTFSNQVIYKNASSRKGVEYTGNYIIENIAKSFIRAEVNYSNRLFGNSYGVRFTRAFLTPNTPYAGGIHLSQERWLAYVPKPDTVLVFPFAYNLADVWVGRAFQLRNSRSNITLAGRVRYVKHIIRPIVEPDTNQLYFNRTNYLLSLSYSKRRYYRDALIYGFGRTEDVPYGRRFSVLGGPETYEFGLRWYGGVEMAYGIYKPHFGYWYFEAQLGGFLNKNQFEQGLGAIEVNYFSNLVFLRKVAFRQFVSLQYTQGLYRFDNEFLTINRTSGIRDFNYNGLVGDQKAIVRLESLFFLPRNYLGFRLATFIFADLGMISYHPTPLWQNGVFQAYGIGFRARNERLTFSSFQVSFGFYPSTNYNNAGFRASFSNTPALRMKDFDIQAPSIVNLERVPNY